MDIKNPQNLKKALAIVSTSTLLAAFGTPSVVPVLKPAVVQAAGAEVDTVTSVPNIKDNETKTKLATIRIKFSEGTQLQDGDYVIVELPEDFEFAEEKDADGNPIKPFTDTSANKLSALNLKDDSDKDISAYFKAEVLGKDRVKIFVDVDNNPNTSDETKIATLGDDGYLYIHLGAIKVDGAEEGPADVEFITGSGASVFPQGKVTVARVLGDGEVELTVTDDDTSNNIFNVTVRVKETTPGSLEVDEETLKLTLPDGYKWKGILQEGTLYGNGQTVTLPAIAGQAAKFVVHIDDDELELELVGVDRNGDGVVDDADKDADGKFQTTSVASIWELPLQFEVDDDTKVKPGDVIVKVSGETDANVTELVVGEYGEYGASIEVSSVKTLFAGQDDQELGEIRIKEGLKESLIEGRTILLTLPEEARWQEEWATVVDGGDVDDADESWSVKADSGVSLRFVGYTGTDNRTAKFEVVGKSSDEATIKLKDVKIAVRPDYEGPIEIEVSGSAGVTGKVKVADVVRPVDVKVENLRNVIIGATNQQAGDIVITEKAAGALDDDDNDKLIVELPSGVKFAKLPKVEVTSGDLSLGTVKLNSTETALEISIEGKSTKASTIRISDVALKVDRTVAEGNVNAEIKGSAVMTTHTYEDWTGYDYAAKVSIANVVTPAPSDQKATVVFTVDNTKYTVNGVEKTADVAPYIKDGRTFLPVRYVAEALGVSSDNILWDAATKTVTLFKGDRVVKLKIGSKVLYVNGTAITMDVAPEIKNGRTMLPIRWVGTALGVTVEWDEQARTVTVKQ